jgi:hypothetical protein
MKFMSTAPIGIAKVLRNECRRRALGAAPGQHPAEHFDAISFAPDEQRFAFRRTRIRHHRRAHPHRQRPQQHPGDGKPHVTALQGKHHERKAGSRIDDRNEGGDVE